MASIKELRDKTVEELRAELRAKQLEQVELKRSHAAGEVANPRQLTKIRREIAQLATLINEAAQSTEENA
ncbi:MAG TPA: 50S ribosomal protein L29 [Verrucomicrobiae bacterium]|nr:50S ribosomal protein L29 [Verrucomicrobiae bacterium]